MSAAALAADLLADGGAAACGDDFFRSRPFLAAEGTTHTLRIPHSAGDLLCPLVVREIPGGGIDAVSPYGYPGIAAPEGVEVDPASVDFAATGLVSTFIRHRLGPPALLGTSERNTVLLADPELPRKSRMSDRQQIRRNERAGYALKVVPGPDTTPAQRAGFLHAYEETMRRTDAAERYFFGARYFEQILSAGSAWLVLAELEGVIVAAAIAADSDGILHYYLSGTAHTHLRDSPMKNILAALTDFATEREQPLNLGGGITAGDPLEIFKRGFANREERWRTSELICDQVVYERLSAAAEGHGYFPAYRSV